MTTAGRYWRLFRVQVRSSVLLGLQYRADFLVDGVVSLFWTLTALWWIGHPAFIRDVTQNLDYVPH